MRYLILSLLAVLDFLDGQYARSLARAEEVQHRWGLPAVKWLRLFKRVAG